MKKLNLKRNILLVAKKSAKSKRKIDYYLRMPNGTEEYAFTRNYSFKCYETCKAGYPVNKVLYAKKADTAFMGLVKYLNYIMPYFVEYYGLPVC